MDDHELKETLACLSQDRKMYSNATKELNDMIERVKLSDEYKRLETYRSIIKKAIEIIEEALHAEAIARFEASERTNKKPFANLGIRVGVKYEYDEGRAYVWAMEHMPAVTMLDKKKFEKAIPIVGLETLGFVQDIETITATIATEIKLGE